MRTLNHFQEIPFFDNRDSSNNNDECGFVKIVNKIATPMKNCRYFCFIVLETLC